MSAVARNHHHLLLIGTGPRPDSAGAWLIGQLSDQLQHLTALHLDDVPLELYQLWQTDSVVLIVTGLITGAPAGTIHRFDARLSPLPAQLFRDAQETHRLAQAVGLARAIDRLPAQLQVWVVARARPEEAAPQASLDPLLSAAREWASRTG